MRPLFDILSDREVEPFYHFESDMDPEIFRQFAESIRLEISNLLNSRSVFEISHPLGFGIKGYGKKSVEKIRQLILKYEPRIKDLSLDLLDNNKIQIIAVTK